VFHSSGNTACISTTQDGQYRLTVLVDRYTLSQYPSGKGVAMPLIIVILALSLLRYLEVGPFAEISWWWIVALIAAAFVWFEFVEKMFGLDKRKAHEQLEKARKERVKKTFEKK
jgi:small Trp-rich protein